MFDLKFRKPTIRLPHHTTLYRAGTPLAGAPAAPRRSLQGEYPNASAGYLCGAAAPTFRGGCASPCGIPFSPNFAARFSSSSGALPGLPRLPQTVHQVPAQQHR